MKVYSFKYRCRLCGEVFEHARTGDEKLAFKCVLFSIWDKPTGYAQEPKLISIHPASTHTGIADFIGAEEIDE